MATEDIQFNPDNYAYMDDIPLAGWMWEFIRRSSDYIKKYQAIKGLTSSFSLSSKIIKRRLCEFEQILPDFDNPLYSELKALESECFIKPEIISEGFPDFRNYLALRVKDRPEYVGIPDPAIRYSGFIKLKPFIHGATTVLMQKFDTDVEDKNLLPWLKGLIHYRLENTLFLSVSRGANLKDVKKDVSKIIKENIQPKKRKKRNSKWKYYLIAYDLREQNKIRYSEITNVMMNFFPENKKLLDEKNVENYHNNALLLIHGQFKKYLNIEK